MLSAAWLKQNSPSNMMPSLQGFRDKLNSRSLLFRSATQTDVTLSPADQAQETKEDQLGAVVKAFKLRSVAELKVPLNA